MLESCRKYLKNCKKKLPESCQKDAKKLNKKVSRCYKKVDRKLTESCREVTKKMPESCPPLLLQPGWLWWMLYSGNWQASTVGLQSQFETCFYERSGDFDNVQLRADFFLGRASLSQSGVSKQ